MTCPERGQVHIQKKSWLCDQRNCFFFSLETILFWENRIKKYGEKFFILMG